jgi:ATP-binding cassette subfamily B protein
MLTFPTVLLGFVIAIVQRGLAALERLGEVLDEVPSIRDREDLVPVTHIDGAVELRELEFRYPGAGRPTLDRVSLAAEAGQTVGIVGPVGSGKSTLVSAIPRLLEIPDGTLFIDGVDVNRLPVRLLRSSIAVVPQDSFLFSTTVADNIRFGKPDASIDEVREAARRAHVLEDVEDFTDGFDTLVGERGITLSGGQRQRVALARALLLDPAILILDDSLSSVDHATEEAILRELSSAKRGRSCFIVAHRISAVRDADLIVVLEDGRTTERGKHDELVRRGGFYARLHRRQQLERQLEAAVDAEDVA